jgi:hypothetical protein
MTFGARRDMKVYVDLSLTVACKRVRAEWWRTTRWWWCVYSALQLDIQASSYPLITAICMRLNHQGVVVNTHLLQQNWPLGCLHHAALQGEFISFERLNPGNHPC